jgi:hypothetical protein
MATTPEPPDRTSSTVGIDPATVDPSTLDPEQIRELFDPAVIRAGLEAAPPAELIELLHTQPPEELTEFLRATQPEELAEALRDDPSVLAGAFEDLPPDELREAVRRDFFDELVAGMTSFVAFVGYSRSGGSIVAALMDAHPELVVVHELDVFESDENGDVLAELAFTSRDDLFAKLTRESNRLRNKRKGERVREDGTRYYSSYRVEGGSQGRSEAPRAIGTKNAVESALVSERFGVEPFRALERLVGLPVRFVHVIRNPYDNIATMKRIHGDRAVIRYRRRVDGVQAVKDAGFPVIDVHLDDVIDDPRRELARICEFYGVEADPDYLDRCAAVVAGEHSRTGETIEWQPQERQAIEDLIERCDWLARYRST